MSSGQTLLTLFALSMLMTISVNVLRIVSANGETVLQAKMGLAAISIGTSIIEEAQGKCFDEFTTRDSAASNLTQLSAPTALGTNATSEIVPNSSAEFDDYDDYNNFTQKLFLSLPDTITAKCKVVYVDPANPSVAASVRTWHKKLSVAVSSPSLQDTVKMEYIFSYWYFR